MPEFVIYGVPGSPFMRSVAATMEEKRAAYVIHALAPGESKSPDYLKLHPFGRIPVINHGGFELYETQAILRYIDAAFPDPALQPEEPEAIGRMSQVMGINDWYLFPQVLRIIVFERIVGPVLFGKAADEAAIEQAMPDARLSIGVLDRLLGNNPFMAGERFSLADLIIAPQLSFFAVTPEGKALLKGTALGAWLARMEERPSMKATRPPEALTKI
jgi:glutathione S-transferase